MHQPLCRGAAGEQRDGGGERKRCELENRLAVNIVNFPIQVGATVVAGYYSSADEFPATVNPNSRPRAEDLVAICCSMAKSAVEPDAALMGRIRQVKDALGAPW